MLLALRNPPAQDPLDLQVAGNGWMIGNPDGCHDLYRTQYITYVIRVKGQARVFDNRRVRLQCVRS